MNCAISVNAQFCLRGFVRARFYAYSATKDYVFIMNNLKKKKQSILSCVSGAFGRRAIHHKESRLVEELRIRII